MPAPASPRRQALDELADAEGLEGAQGDGAVAGVLIQLAAPGLALLLHLGDGLIDHAHQLQDDARRDVGHDAQGEDRHVLERAAARTC